MRVETNQTVLIVDDSTSNVAMLTDLLSPLYTIRSASRGAQAIKSLQLNPLVDLIVLDVMMPDMDGFETCEILKADPLTEDIPIIFITGLSEDNSEARGLALGAVDFITKPFNISLVKARIRNQMELKRHRNELESLVAQRTSELLRSQQHAIEAKDKLEISYQNLRELSEHIQMAREDERNHIARELHDELGQSLTALKIDISWLKMKVPSIDTAIYEKLKSVDDLLDSTVDSLRHIYEDLRPGMLDDLGLVSAAEYQITKFIEQSGISCEFSVNQTEIEVPKKVAINLFRILQESLTNIIRHASAGNVKVILHDLKNEILLIIEDDGRGIKMLSNCEDSRKRYGILGMQERVHVLGGKIDFISEQGEGTRIEISVPINSEVAA